MTRTDAQPPPIDGQWVKEYHRAVWHFQPTGLAVTMRCGRKIGGTPRAIDSKPAHFACPECVAALETDAQPPPTAPESAAERFAEMFSRPPAEAIDLPDYWQAPSVADGAWANKPHRLLYDCLRELHHRRLGWTGQPTAEPAEAGVAGFDDMTLTVLKLRDERTPRRRVDMLSDEYDKRLSPAGFYALAKLAEQFNCDRVWRNAFRRADGYVPPDPRDARIAELEAEVARLEANLEQTHRDLKDGANYCFRVDSELAAANRRFGEVVLALRGGSNPKWCAEAQAVISLSDSMIERVGALQAERDEARADNNALMLAIGRADCSVSFTGGETTVFCAERDDLRREVAHLRALAGTGEMARIAETGRTRDITPNPEPIGEFWSKLRPDAARVAAFAGGAREDAEAVRPELLDWIDNDGTPMRVDRISEDFDAQTTTFYGGIGSVTSPLWDQWPAIVEPPPSLRAGEPTLGDASMSWPAVDAETLGRIEINGVAFVRAQAQSAAPGEDAAPATRRMEEE